MRHKVSRYQLSRPTNQRMLMFRVMTTNFLRTGHIKTTVAKAKALQPITEKMITLSKKDDFNNRRKAHKFITNKSVVERLFSEIGPSVQDINGGYTRIVKLGRRTGDSAEMAILELIEREA